MEFDVKKIITKRRSVRSYDPKPVEKDVLDKLFSYAESLENPLGPKIRLQLINKKTAANGEKLGTYGIIKGAETFLGVTVPKEEYALEALGYEFEQVVLYATSLNLGTCWMGGTFNRSAFTAAMNIKENELFPILSPIGYIAEKKSFAEKIMSKTVNSRARLAWNELFFDGDFSAPLSEEAAGEYAYPFEMLRLAPSAVNKQPWRVVVTDKAVHFFKKNTLGGNNSESSMQNIDMGIGICHFHMAALEKGLKGHFGRKTPDIKLASDTSYTISWIAE